MRLAVIYGLFAIVATAANIGFQELVTRLYAGEFAVLAAMAAGTIVGLLVKYMLDKRYIFQFRPVTVFHDGWIFFLYSLSGALTTAIFWAFELAFHAAFHSKGLRYVGGIIGLGLGYALKYRLDRRWAFRRKEAHR